jgi:cytochrome c-type biogenesis protein CcmH/NrfG
MENQTETIDKFLRGELSAEEKAAFETQLASDTALAEELALQQDMERFLSKRAQRSALQGQLTQMGPEFFQTAPLQIASRQTPVWRWAVGIAATVLLLVFAARWVFQPSLYSQFAQHPQLALVEKSASASKSTAELEQIFNNGDYQRALPLLQVYTAQHPADAQGKLYLGICFLEEKKYTEARQIFGALQQDASASIADFATWYLALTALREGDKAAARELLKKIGPESEFSEKAGDLVKRLK